MPLLILAIPLITGMAIGYTGGVIFGYTMGKKAR